MRPPLWNLSASAAASWLAAGCLVCTHGLHAPWVVFCCLGCCLPGSVWLLLSCWLLETVQCTHAFRVVVCGVCGQLHVLSQVLGDVPSLPGPRLCRHWCIPACWIPHAQDAAVPCLQSYGLSRLPGASHKVMVMEHLDGTLDTVPWNVPG